MLRACAALSIFGLLALVFMIGLNSGNRAISGIAPGHIDFEPMIHAKNGQPITLEIVQKDVLWHRDTAKHLRKLN